MKFKFRKLINLYQQPVYSLAYHMLGNQAEAEDATQEVYERLWRHIDDIQEDEAKYWLLRVTKNLCIDLLRKKHDTEELPEEPECPRDMDTPTGHLAQQQLSTWLRSAINKLKEPYRSLIVMRDIQQLSIREIASSLKLKENNVKVSLHRGRKQLREILQGVEL